jgi:transcriptional regulator with XRE-family HTH domain
MTDVAHTLGEFIAAWNAGQRPRLADYLARVPPAERDDLADQIQTFMLYAPEPEYSEDAWAEMTSDPAVSAAAHASFAEPEPWPSLLPRLRERAGVSWAQVAERLGFRDREKAAQRLAEMEAGRLPSTAPTWSLLRRLGEVLGVSAETLDWRGGGPVAPAPMAAGALRAADADAEAREQMDDVAELLLSEDEEPDEVDAEFLGGRE